MALDLNGIKTQIQSLLDAANTTTASTDLSSGMETRVQQVLTLNPARIPVQATWYPFVTCYIDSKSMEDTTIARDQASGKRKAQVDVKIVGAVWNSTVTNANKDDADDDCESLMENIEQILRASPTLNDAVKWSFPTEVTYHNMALEEQTSIRAGILNLKATAFY